MTPAITGEGTCWFSIHEVSERSLPRKMYLYRPMSKSFSIIHADYAPMTLLSVTRAH
jgi:hypothetical protein